MCIDSSCSLIVIVKTGSDLFTVSRLESSRIHDIDDLVMNAFAVCQKICCTQKLVTDQGIL